MTGVSYIVFSSQIIDFTFLTVYNSNICLVYFFGLLYIANLFLINAFIFTISNIFSISKHYFLIIFIFSATILFNVVFLKSGLDYTKIVILNKTEYLDNKDAIIDKDEFNEMIVHLENIKNRGLLPTPYTVYMNKSYNLIII